MDRQMKPRHIDLVGGGCNPLTDVFGKAEAEQAAAMLILTLGAGPWAEATLSALAAVITAAKDIEPVSFWLRNPAFRPDVDRLIADGFAEWVNNGAEGRKRPVRFTEAGLKALRLSRWNTCTVTVCSECLRASCWQGAHYCEDYVGASSVDKTPYQLLALQKSGEAQLEDSSYWDICDQCGVACGGKCDGRPSSSR